MQHRFSIAAAAVITLALASAASGQALGDVARKEEARRKAVAPKPGKVYTNEDLRPVDPTSTPAPAQAPATAAPAAPAQGKPEEKPADDPKKDEAYWRTRMAQLRDGLQRAKMFQEALQTRINSLSNDFASRDDPAQRNVVASDRQKALAELDRVKKEIADFEKQITDLEDEARKAGVPPGWLR
jgi:hypothetical protein